MNEEQEIPIQEVQVEENGQESSESSEDEFQEVLEERPEQEGAEGNWQEVGEPHQEMELDRSRFPTRGRWFKMRRKRKNEYPEDQWMSAVTWMKAKVTQRLKMDRYGRVYFNIQYEDRSVGGTYLAMDNKGLRDPDWSLMNEEEEREMGT